MVVIKIRYYNGCKVFSFDLQLVKDVLFLGDVNLDCK